MLAEFVTKLLSLGTPHTVEHEGLTYVDKTLNRLSTPEAPDVETSTLQGLVDLYAANLDQIERDDVLVHITSPTTAQIISRLCDDYGRRHVYAQAKYPAGCTTFPFGQWLNPENFVISAQAGFQRVSVESQSGELLHDLDYVVKIASGISAQDIQTSADDGVSQQVGMQRGIVLKGQETLKPHVNLAPYRTFAEIDQVVSRFVFRARHQGNIQLALFEGDGGRWRIDAVAAIAEWLKGKFGDTPIIS